MTEREKILGRIREALAVPAPLPGSHGGGEPHTHFNGRPVHVARGWLPSGGNTFEEQVAHFRAASAELKTDFRLFDQRDEAFAALAQIRDAEGWQRVATHRAELAVSAAASLGLPVLQTDDGYDVNALEACDVGISGCDALVAQTGTVVVTNRSAGGRALSVLPPHHVVVATRDQLVRDLTAAFVLVQERYSPNYPSMISFITGPSRTGDIERILVLGAHGPKKLTVLCW
jgi:L-lactate dehydrogenase complex protein LldG